MLENNIMVVYSNTSKYHNWKINFSNVSLIIEANGGHIDNKLYKISISSNYLFFSLQSGKSLVKNQKNDRVFREALRKNDLVDIRNFLSN